MKILLLEMDLTNKIGNNDMDELEDVLEELEMSYDCIKLLAEEYVNIDNKLQIMDTPTKESVVRDILKKQGLVDNKDSDNDEKEEEKEVKDEWILYNEKKMALEVVKKYLEQLQFATEDDIYLL
ncbi:8593_t:CDS:1 [Cetraspora pellucida]|uniref:8593_t:CDS:1 n=1 Tax=Cetraspora pellucida TaxID=1433469 RepID=A0A9N9HXV3_9GLOM|nr:8593_t:CDS:1 [Cetraspora pellucida]